MFLILILTFSSQTVNIFLQKLKLYLKLRLASLREYEKNDLIKLYKGETLEAEELKKQLDETTNALENIDANYAKLEAKLKDLEKSKKLLEKKHENTCKEFKAVKDENDDMKKDLTMCEIKLKR